MLSFINDIHPVVVDAAVVAIIVLVSFFGVLRGIKKSAINFAAIVMSFFLGFCSYTDSVKKVIIEKIWNVTKIAPAGSGTGTLFGMSMFGNIVSSLGFALLCYLVIRVIIILFSIIRKKSSQGEKEIGKASRITGGVFSFIYSVVVLLVALFTMNNNVIGGSEVIQGSAVTKLMVNQSEKVLNKIDNGLVDKFVFKVFCGDILYKVDDEMVSSFSNINQNIEKITKGKEYIGILEDNELPKETVLNLSKERIKDLYSLSVITNCFDEYNEPLTGMFANLAEDVLKAVNKQMKNRGYEAIEYDANEIGIIRLSLKDAGVNENVLKLLDEITVGK